VIVFKVALGVAVVLIALLLCAAVMSDRGDE
jgi:hypothetical protein